MVQGLAGGSVLIGDGEAEPFKGHRDVLFDPQSVLIEQAEILLCLGQVAGRRALEIIARFLEVLGHADALDVDEAKIE